MDDEAERKMKDLEEIEEDLRHQYEQTAEPCHGKPQQNEGREIGGQGRMDEGAYEGEEKGSFLCGVTSQEVQYCTRSNDLCCYLNTVW